MNALNTVNVFDSIIPISSRNYQQMMEKYEDAILASEVVKRPS